MIYVFLLRATNRILSVTKMILYRAVYTNRLKTSSLLSNHFKGKLQIHILDKQSHVSLGMNNISVGPLYILVSGAGNIKIGNNNYFNHNVSITSKKNIIIGNGCMVGNNVVIVDHDHDIKSGIEKIEYKSEDVIIEDNCWIGANVTITKGVRIGEHAVVAANSVVTHSIPKYELWGGAPAKKINRCDGKN